MPFSYPPVVIPSASNPLANDIAFPNDISPPQITADQNNYNPTGLSTATILRLNTDASRTITGLAGGADGRIIILRNVGTAAMVLGNEHANSTASNRFSLPQNRTLYPGRSIWLFYDNTLSRWTELEGSTRATGYVNLFAGTDDEAYLTNKHLFDITTPVAVSYTASLTLNFAAGLNWDVSALTGSLTLNNPTGLKAGMSGRVRLPQDATGSRTWSVGAYWKFPGGVTALSTGANDVDLLVFFVRSTTEIECTLLKDMT